MIRHTPERKKPQMIKLVTFDLDDTLWAVQPTMKRANRRLWEWLSNEAPAYVTRFEPSDLMEGSALRRALLERYPEIAHSMTEVRIRLLEEGMKEIGYSEAQAQELAASAFDHFMMHRNAVTPYDEAIPMLESLKAMELKIAALSNGNADVTQTPLAPWFDFQFNADLVGTAKPHRLMFDKALDRACAKACEAVHIGDHPINDIQAAKALGMHTIWVNPELTEWSVPAEADFHLDCLSEIPGVICQLSGR